MRKVKGFTLIELLIVVAIIAILAAIAVPNFLEAQTRSKVSRTKSDQRTMATAMEAYFVDNNAYLWPSVNIFKAYPSLPDEVLGGLLWGPLTTPISYITSIPTDVFMPDEYRADMPAWGKMFWATGTYFYDRFMEEDLPPGVERLRERLIPLESMPLVPPPVRLAEPDQVRRFLHGDAVSVADGERIERVVVVYAADGRLLGVAEQAERLLRPKVVLAQRSL